MDAESSMLLPNRDKSLILSPEYLDLNHDFYEYEQGLGSDIIAASRLRTHIQFWKSIGASPYILDVIATGYRIPIYSIPSVSFSDNNKSALANAGFVEEAIGSLSNHDDERRTTTGSNVNVTAQARTNNSVVVVSSTT